MCNSIDCTTAGVGILRLGWLTHYLSHAVVSGFMTGASITIGMSQVKYLLGATSDADHGPLMPVCVANQLWLSGVPHVTSGHEPHVHLLHVHRLLTPVP